MSGSNKIFCKNIEYENPLCSPFVNMEELKDVPLKEVPTTAQEFLVSVIAERRNIKEARYKGTLENLRKNQSQFYDEAPLPPIHHRLKPTKEWQNIQVADFSEVRSYISRMRNNKSKQITRCIKEMNKVHIHVYADLKWWRVMVKTRTPTLSSVLDLKAAKVDQSLIYLTRLVQEVKPGDSIDHNTGQWMYALLSCLKQPLHSDSISVIRDMAKACWTIRSKIDPDDEKASELAAPLTLIICIVGQYYGQLDLADT